MPEIKNIYHFHVQKTGGVSLNEAFKEICRRRGKKFQPWSYPNVLNDNVFYSHQHTAIKPTPPHTFAITILREPISRLFSRYRHILWLAKGWERGSRLHRSQERRYRGILENDFEWFVKHMPEKEKQHTLTIYGNPTEKAFQNIESHINFVLFQDTLQDDFNRLCSQIGEEPFRLPRMQDSHKQYKITWTPTDEEINLANKVTQEEQKLWNAAQVWRKR